MRFSFFLFNSKQPVDRKHLLWEQWLPDSRHVGTSQISNNVTPRIRYGEYFRAIVLFLERNGFELLLNAIEHRIKRLVPLHEVDFISIFLEKHGAFYHPARIEVFIGDSSISFVVNLAVTEQGMSCMKREIIALKHLNSIVLDFLPKVYGYCLNEVFGSTYLSMFLGEWFAGFHEFHLSTCQASGQVGVAIWDSDGVFFLSETQAKDLYRRIAIILSSYYDLISTRQVFPWHNASGDFVVQVCKKGIRVRMITARDFTPMLMNTGCYLEKLSQDEIIYALMIFFLHVTIRTRLDRMDGVGELALADEALIPSIVEGFFQGLHFASENSGLPNNFPIFFKNYLLGYREKNLLNLAIETIEKIYKNRRNEAEIISEHLVEHVSRIYSFLKQ